MVLPLLLFLQFSALVTDWTVPQVIQVSGDDHVQGYRLTGAFLPLPVRLNEAGDYSWDLSTSILGILAFVLFLVEMMTTLVMMCVCLPRAVPCLLVSLVTLVMMSSSRVVSALELGNMFAVMAGSADHGDTSWSNGCIMMLTPLICACSFIGKIFYFIVQHHHTGTSNLERDEMKHFVRLHHFDLFDE